MSLYPSTFKRETSGIPFANQPRGGKSRKHSDVFFLRKEYLRHGIPTGTDSQQLGQQCGAIALVFEGVKKNIETYRNCKKIQ